MWCLQRPSHPICPDVVLFTTSLPPVPSSLSWSSDWAVAAAGPSFNPASPTPQDHHPRVLFLGGLKTTTHHQSYTTFSTDWVMFCGACIRRQGLRSLSRVSNLCPVGRSCSKKKKLRVEELNRAGSSWASGSMSGKTFSGRHDKPVSKFRELREKRTRTRLKPH